MRNFFDISLCALLLLLFGCSKDIEFDSPNSDSTTSSVVEVLEDGRLRVTATLKALDMSDVSVSTRTTQDENAIIDGWALVFGEEPSQQTVSGSLYTDNSPLIQKVPLTINADGTFYMTFDPYAGVAFIRIVANLTTREDISLGEAISWADTDSPYEVIDGVYWLTVPSATDLAEGGNGEDVGTFLEYKYQSVGLDGIYDIEYNTKPTGALVTETSGLVNLVYDSVNENVPVPTNPSKAIPMSSVGYVLDDGITEKSVADMFGKTIYMVRVCSKVDISIDSDCDFSISEIYMLDCAQESRVRSTVLSMDGEDGSAVDSVFTLPTNLGGTITYAPLIEDVSKGGSASTPIYFYPNSGGNYDSNSGGVDRDVNPQYVVFKGRNANYDSDGYYKIALKGQYPISYNYDDNGDITSVKEYSSLTYDILRNTHFNVEILSADKPGYKTLEDASDENNPASNISYNISITSIDGRNEILVSNGTYYVELATTRVYMCGYEGTGNKASVEFTIYPNDSDASYQHPAVYVMADYGVEVESCYADGVKQDTVKLDSGDVESYVNDYCFKVDTSKTKTNVVVNFSATSSGRVRLRIGDMLKFIPVRYSSAMFSTTTADSLVIGTEDDFSYDDIVYLESDSTLTQGYTYDINSTVASSTYDWFTSDGVVALNTESVRELRAKIYPKSVGGITKLYFKQSVTSSIEDPNARVEEGNVVELGTNYNTDSDEQGNLLYSSSEQAAAAAIVTMLEQGYETIYFDGDADSMDIDEIMKYLVDYIDASTTLDSSTRFTVDISTVTDTGQDFGAEGENGEDYFLDNPYIETIVIPGDGTVMFKENTFVNCANLKVVIVASVDDPSGNFKEIKSNAFVDCPNLETIIVYTTVNDAYMEQTAGKITSKNTTAKISIVNGSGYMYLWGEYPDDYDASYYTK